MHASTARMLGVADATRVRGVPNAAHKAKLIRRVGEYLPVGEVRDFGVGLPPSLFNVLFSLRPLPGGPESHLLKSVRLMDDWPESPPFPISVYHDMLIDHLQDMLQRTLQTLVKPVSISQDCTDALQQHIPHRSLAQQVDHNATCDTLLSKRQPQRYGGRNMAMLEAVRPEGAPMDALARDPTPPPPPTHNFDGLANELVGILEVYEGDDATSTVEAPPVAVTVSSAPFVPSVLGLDRGGRCHFYR